MYTLHLYINIYTLYIIYLYTHTHSGCLFFLSLAIYTYIFYLNCGFNVALHAFPLILHSTFPSPFFSYKANLIFFPTLLCLYSLILLLPLPLPSPNLFSFSESSHISFSFLIIVLISLQHRWQTQGLWAKSGPPPCFIRPGTLFLLGGPAEPSLNC